MCIYELIGDIMNLTTKTTTTKQFYRIYPKATEKSEMKTI